MSTQFDVLIDALLLLPETREAPPLVAVIPGYPEKLLCIGTKQELMEGLASEFWKRPPEATRPVRRPIGAGAFQRLQTVFRKAVIRA